MYYADKCCNGVRWKKSTKYFELHMFTIISNTCYKIKNNKYKVGKTFNFIINERGKIRSIDAPYIQDRLVHKILSNEILMPIYEPHLIYDNGASQKNKGFKFALYRVKEKLNKFYKRNNQKGYIVVIDYSKFFENCSHTLIREIHNKYIENKYTIKVIEDYLFIGKGIALGVEIAQREASIIPNLLDHYIENNNGYLNRYIDDSLFICNSYEKAKLLLNEYLEISKILKIKINTNKTKIIDINDYLKYCKWKFKIFKSNKVILIPDKSTIYRQLRKLRKMKQKNIPFNEIKIVKDSFKAYLSIGNSYKYQMKIDEINN